MNYNNYYHGKNVLVTGGMGFIGSNLVLSLLELGANVIVVDSMTEGSGANRFNLPNANKNLIIHKIDIRNKDKIEQIITDIDLIFNLAGQLSHTESMQHPLNDLSINIEGQVNILETCKKVNRNAKILYTSTRQIYGKPQYLPVNELHPIVPVDVNGINKYAAEQYHLLYHKIYGIKSIILRLTNTYGPRIRIKDAKQTFIGAWLRNCLENRPITIFGDGSQIRDLTYIDDLIHAMLLAMMNDKAIGNVFNISGEKVSLIDLAKCFQALDSNYFFELQPFPDERKVIDIGSYFADDMKIRDILGWQARTNLLEGLNFSLEYYKNNFKHYVEDIH